MKISDALLYVIHKNGNKMSTPQLLDYFKQLMQYNCIDVNKDGVTFSLTDRGIDRLVSSKLI